MSDAFTVTERVWPVGALCRAIADVLDARLNPVCVSGEISGYTRAASGHSYFSLKDEAGQLRCAMFRRAAGGLSFTPRDGDVVELRGRVSVYEPRGELQLVVETMSRAGQGTLFEQFVLRKAKLEALGLFSPQRKRQLPAMLRRIGVVTSLGAAALHDVLSALKRRAPHVEVLISPAAVQGEAAPPALCSALESLYGQSVDAILLVRGGGAMEDLWAFNDEALAHMIARSPVPVVTGVGHETDFTIADFVADLRAPTPTAAAEMVTASTLSWIEWAGGIQGRLQLALSRRMERAWQRHDVVVGRFGRPSQRLNDQRLRLSQLLQRAQHGVAHAVHLGRARQAVQAARLESLNPQNVLRRGYTMLTDQDGSVVVLAARARVGATLHANLVDGVVDVTVGRIHLN